MTCGIALALLSAFTYAQNNDIDIQSTNCFSEKTCFTEIISKRHSGYDFDNAKAVPESLIIQLADAARFSPSSYNEQPWRFIFCDREKTPEAYLKAVECLMGGNQDWAQDAPLLVIVASNTKFSRNQKPNLWSQFDTGAAVMSFCYKATSLGLMTHEIGGFYEAMVRDEFAIPADFIPLAVIAVGYEKAGEAEQPIIKDRRPLAEHFFWGTWGHGIKE